MGLLITTGKSPGASARSVAKALFLCFPHSCLEGRGKRSLSSLAAKARKKSIGRICALYSEAGKPCSLQVLSLSKAGFEWLAPRIMITGVSLHQLPKRKAQACCVQFKGTKAASLRNLFCGDECNECEKGCKSGSKISTGADKITLCLSGKKLLTLGVEYEG